ncbi:hypothetical protein EMCRGX_G031988 [Ephydatia muelleri]
MSKSAQLKIGDKVQSKCKVNFGAKGIISSIIGNGNRKKFVVDWDLGSQSIHGLRGICRDGQLPLQKQYTQPTKRRKTAVALLDEEGSTYDDSTSSSEEYSEEGESDTELPSNHNSDVQHDDQDQDVPRDRNLFPHGRQWELLPDLVFDPAVHDKFTQETRIKWNQVEQLKSIQDRTEIDYFFHFYPMQTVQQTLNCMGERLARKRYNPISKGEFFKWLGIRLAMTIEPRRGGIQAYWKEGEDPHTFSLGASMGSRAKMSRHRFEEIQECLAFCSMHDGIAPEDDPWKEIRLIIDGFNDNRQQGIIPGSHIAVDEVMSAWYGAEATWVAEGMPHVTKIPRKPEGEGAEMKALADGQTKILIRLDVMEGKEHQRKKAFADIGSEGTAVTLRLTQPWFGSGRVVHADSAFSSVKTCMALRQYGLHFMGIIKTAHKEYPLTYLTSKADEYGTGKVKPRGGHLLLRSTMGPDDSTHPPIFALGWYDKKGKYLISSCGTTLPGIPCKRPRFKKIVNNDGFYETVAYTKEVRRPAMVEEFFSCFSSIDIHDHYRQGSLEMERQWVTRRWHHRIFCTVLGICIVDSFFAQKFEVTMINHEPNDFNTFCGRLARQLIFNEFLGNIMPTRDGTENEQVYVTQHTPNSLASLDAYKDKRAQRKCKVCKMKTAMFCNGCSNPPNEILPLCSGMKDRDCFAAYHCQQGIN